MEIAVYCRWDDGPSREVRLAQDVGRTIALAGHSLVFGAGVEGIMGVLAKAAKDNGGTVTAVTIDEWVTEEDWQLWDTTIVSPDLGNRKAVMDGMSDAVLVLPGSIGTLSELFVSIEHSQGRRPTVIVDPWGYYDGLLEWLPSVLRPGFMPSRTRSASAAIELVQSRVLAVR